MTAPAFRATDFTAYAARTDTTVNKPTGTVDGDIMIAVVLAGTSVSLATIVQTPPAGWTQIGTTANSAAGTSFYAKLYVYWKRASGEGASYTWTHSTLNTNIVIASYSGCIASGDPVDVFSQNGATGSTATGLSVTTTVADTKLIYGQHNWDGTGLTPPTGMTERYDSVAYLADQDIAAVGSTGNRTQTVISNPWQAYMVALKPVASGGGGSSKSVKVWDGSAWVTKPTKVWSGSAWVAKPVRVWDGTAWKPPIVYQDNFNRADANLEASPVASGGWSWTHDGLIAGAGSIVSNQIRCNTLSSTGSVYTVPPFPSADHYVQYKTVATGAYNTFPAACRIATHTDYLGIRAAVGGAVEVYRKVAGAFTLLYTSPTSTVVVGDVIRLECQGTNFTVKKNGVVLTGPAGIGAVTLTSTTAGMVMRGSTGVLFDDFEAGTL